MSSVSVVSFPRPLEADQLASVIRMLPPLPEVANKILAKFGDEFISAKDVADIVECDPAISARLFGLANSAYFGLSTPVTQMREVVSRVLGPDTVRSLAFALATQQSFDLGRCTSFDSRRFWHRALYSSASASRIANVIEDIKPEVKEFANLAGLCHGLGVLALACCYPEKTNQIFKLYDNDENADMESLCREQFTFSFDDVTYELARHWDMPEPIITAYQHRANKTADANLLAAIVNSAVKSARYTQNCLSQSDGAEVELPDFEADLPYVESSALEVAAIGTESQRMATMSRLQAMVG